MCTTGGAGETLVIGLAFALVLGAAPLAAAWHAQRARTRGARLVAAGTLVALALLTIAMRPSGPQPPYAPTRKLLLDAMAYGLTYVYAALAAAWALLSWRSPRSPIVERAALALTAVPLVLVLAWASYEAFGPNVCDEIMRAQPTTATPVAG